MEQTFSDKLLNLKRQSLSNMVEEQLEKLIISGELQPGERINESDLSNRYKISRAPIREACRQLAQYGMVENRVGKGTFVRKVNLNEAIELYEIRGMLDALAAEHASQHAGSDEVEELEKLLEQLQKFAKTKSTTEYFAVNLKFHQQIVRSSNNLALMDIYEVVFKKLSLFRQKTLSKPDRLQRSLSQHEGILDAIKQRDVKLAGKLARSHVEEAKEILKTEK